jgi:hypothetical protein
MRNAGCACFSQNSPAALRDHHFLLAGNIAGPPFARSQPDEFPGIRGIPGIRSKKVLSLHSWQKDRFFALLAARERACKPICKVASRQ